ncbi:RNA-directed DNA polymerase, eukaryota, reverse transcriptase zinc-binding domain protein [Tanacetum coccineum]
MMNGECLPMMMAQKNKWPLFQLDVNSGFLYGDLEDDVYITVPQGFFDNNNKNKVCKLVKSLYGLKQAPKKWNEKLVSVLKEIGFLQSAINHSLFTKSKINKFIDLLIYVDDIVITANCVNEIDQFKAFLKSKLTSKTWEILMTSLVKFLNLEMICLSQRKYYLELLKEYGLLGCKPVSTPMEPKFVLSYITTSANLKHRKIKDSENALYHRRSPWRLKTLNLINFTLRTYERNSRWIPDFMEDDEEESDTDDELRDEELPDESAVKMEGDECLQNIHDEKVAYAVKKTCPLSNPKDVREGSICSGEWVPNGKKLLIISVYAPQELSEKKMLWEYLTLVIDNWNGEVVIMSDFNEVRKQAERYGSIFNMQDKSPGPDRFTFGFYRCGNSSFIALIPKMYNAKMVKDFRPITLIGSLYKIIAKILANRLVVVLGDIVNEGQSTFVANRQILDGPFILNELFHWYEKKKKQTMIFKVDFEKAYDSGDPLSPFLFILIMESLHISVQSVVDAGMFKVQVLECFYRASGLRINLNKSKLMGILVANVIVDQAAAKIGCAMLEAPLSYLGSKVGGLMSRVQSWNEIVNNLIAHLSNWKMKTLFIGGILTLLKSVLGSMPIYHISLFNVPVKVLQIMEYIRCHFFNDANHNGSSLWARVIKGIHGEDGKLGKNVNHSHPSIWLDIVREMEQLKNYSTNLIGFIHKKMGNGDDTSFWEHVWRGDGAFKSLYLRIYALDTCKNDNVAVKMSHGNVGYSLR